MKSKKEFIDIHAKEIKVAVFSKGENGFKEHNIQMVNVGKQQIAKIKAEMSNHADSMYYFSGESRDFFMVEFHGENMAAIEKACQSMIDIIGIGRNDVAGWEHQDFEKAVILKNN